MHVSASMYDFKIQLWFPTVVFSIFPVSNKTIRKQKVPLPHSVLYMTQRKLLSIELGFLPLFCWKGEEATPAWWRRALCWAQQRDRYSAAAGPSLWALFEVFRLIPLYTNIKAGQISSNSPNHHQETRNWHPNGRQIDRRKFIDPQEPIIILSWKAHSTYSTKHSQIYERRFQNVRNLSSSINL